MGNDTPFFAALTEDKRLLQPTQPVFGDNDLLWEWQVYQYWTRNDTFWHANDGDPTHGRYLYGSRYQWPLFDPVTADTGALHVIPGSHLRGFSIGSAQNGRGSPAEGYRRSGGRGLRGGGPGSDGHRLAKQL